MKKHVAMAKAQAAVTERLNGSAWITAQILFDLLGIIRKQDREISRLRKAVKS